MTEQINVGDVLGVRATFTNRAGAPTDPTSVTLYVEKPDGTQLTYTSGFTAYDGSARTVSSGAYSHDVPLDQAGWWRARWVATGAVAAAEPDKWYVERDAFVVGP